MRAHNMIGMNEEADAILETIPKDVFSNRRPPNAIVWVGPTGALYIRLTDEAGGGLLYIKERDLRFVGGDGS